MYKLLTLLILLVLSGCGKQEIWCFVGSHRELRCHSTEIQCQRDWHIVWDRDISMNIQHPLPCEEY